MGATVNIQPINKMKTIKLNDEVISACRQASATPGMDVRGGSAAGDRFGKAADAAAEKYFAKVGRAAFFVATHGGGEVSASCVEARA